MVHGQVSDRERRIELMNADYFSHSRGEILEYLPKDSRRFFELGCGTGATLRLIKDWLGNPEGLWLAGAELNTEMAATAREVADQVWTGDVEILDLSDEVLTGSVDVILCLDVLEHLVDPWSMVRKITPMLKPGGILIASIPNVRHWKFIRNLLFRADFNYRDSGLLDRTHLRFFVKDTAIELVTCGGLRLHKAVPSRKFEFMDMRWLLQKITGGRLEELLVKQYLYVAKMP